ncbi:hypothetical protein B0H16DRAFT_1731936 [Mycena metata]|uniref:Uncharacterized protein n=1 Tax=Mycena metata TaxID=1033252 RepID=A0AAD7I3C5_9AGAR|nr:hypothetical protein B0H16DRAFT_1731936 [Mycena metata]
MSPQKVLQPHHSPPSSWSLQTYMTMAPGPVTLQLHLTLLPSLRNLPLERGVQARISRAAIWLLTFRQDFDHFSTFSGPLPCRGAQTLCTPLDLFGVQAFRNRPFDSLGDFDLRHFQMTAQHPIILRLLLVVAQVLSMPGHRNSLPLTHLHRSKSLRFSLEISKTSRPLPWAIFVLTTISAITSSHLLDLTIDFRVDENRDILRRLHWAELDAALCDLHLLRMTSFAYGGLPFGLAQERQAAVQWFTAELPDFLPPARTRDVFEAIRTIPIF